MNTNDFPVMNKDAVDMLGEIDTSRYKVIWSSAMFPDFKRTYTDSGTGILCFFNPSDLIHSIEKVSDED